MIGEKLSGNYSIYDVGDKFSHIKGIVVTMRNALDSDNVLEDELSHMAYTLLYVSEKLDELYDECRGLVIPEKQKGVENVG